MYTNKLSLYRIIISIVISWPLISCDDGIHEFQIPFEPDKIVIGATFPTDTSLFIHITSSDFLIGEVNPINSIKDATIHIYEENNIIEIINYQSEYNYTGNTILNPSFYYSHNSFKPQSGKSYSIEVYVDGYTRATASTTILNKIALKSVSFDSVNVDLSDKYSGYPVSIEFIDPIAEENYYMIEVLYDYFRPSYGSNFINKDVTSSIPAAIQDRHHTFYQGSNPSHSIFFSDTQFNGEKYTYSFFVYSRGIESSLYRFERYDPNDDNGYPESDANIFEISFVLKHITKEHYEFGITSELQNKTRDDFLAEPVLIKSNVENGLGIFAGYSYDIKSVFYKHD